MHDLLKTNAALKRADGRADLENSKNIKEKKEKSKRKDNIGYADPGNLENIKKRKCRAEEPKKTSM